MNSLFHRTVQGQALRNSYQTRAYSKLEELNVELMGLMVALYFVIDSITCLTSSIISSLTLCMRSALPVTVCAATATQSPWRHTAALSPWLLSHTPTLSSAVTHRYRKGRWQRHIRRKGRHGKCSWQSWCLNPSFKPTNVQYNRKLSGKYWYLATLRS